MNLLGRRLVRAMDARKLNQTQLAAKLGLKKNAVSTWITGKNVPDEANLRRIAEILKVPAAYLLALDPQATSGNVDDAEPVATLLRRYRESRSATAHGDVVLTQEAALAILSSVRTVENIARTLGEEVPPDQRTIVRAIQITAESALATVEQSLRAGGLILIDVESLGHTSEQPAKAPLLRKRK